MRSERFVNEHGEEFLYLGLSHEEASVSVRPDGISVSIGPISVHDWGRLRDIALPVEKPSYIGSVEVSDVLEDDRA